MIPVFIISQFLTILLALTCYQGTSNSLSNCSTSEECLSFLFNTSLDGLTPPTSVYTCGNYSFYQQLPYISNLSFCTTDNCQILDTPQSFPACGSLLTETNCTTRPDCFWCGNASFGVDLCQPLPGSFIQECWAVPIIIPITTCGYINCAPYVPAYSVENLTLQFLMNFGFPPVTSIGDTQARGIALDAQSRYGNMKIMNDTYNFCVDDLTLQQWCGVDTWHPFSYCIISETWPQLDTWGWIQNTTFTAPSLTTIYPAFCACPIAGRAYYLPTGQVDNTVHYGPSCPVEHAMLAFYILLMVCTVIVFVFVLYDTSILFISTGQSISHSFESSWEYFQIFMKRLFKNKTIWTKLLVLLYLIIALPNQIVFTTLAGTNSSNLAMSRAILRFLGLIILLLSYGLAVFTCVEILLKAKVFGTRRDAIALRIFKWYFFIRNIFFLASLLTLVIVFSYYLKILLDLRVPNLAELTRISKIDAALAQTIMLAVVCIQALMMIETFIMLCIVTWKIKHLPKRVRGMKDVMGRVVGLWIAWVCGLPDLGLLAFITPVISWITTGVIPSYWTSSYQTSMAYSWLIFGNFSTELFWICAIAYALRTRAKKGWLQAQFSLLLGKKTMVDEETNSGTSATGSDSRAMSTTSAATVQSFDSSHS